MTAAVATQVRPAADEAAISVRGVYADYGSNHVLDGIDFDVRRGEIFGLIGLNGVGKTTLIKIILGLMEATQGAVSLFGRETLEVESKAMLAYLPEKFEPPFFLSGLEFVKFSLETYSRPFTAEEVEKAADRVSLSREALRRRVNTYSKGMRQKIGLMGTWLTGCPLLILDEPMSGLDPRARVLVKDEIAACRKKGMTVFLSSHILSDMDELCDRIGVIHDQKLRFLGKPEELRQKTGLDSLERAFLKIIEDSKRVYES